jgi:myo-inositol-1(or 4)-monophosphatase
MHPYLNTAVRAARAAGRIILRSMDRIERLHIERKGHNDFVSDVDRKAEAAILEVLQQAYPDHAVLAEESGAQEGRDGYRWIIDPLDGTTNYLHGFPAFSVSIALEYRGRLEQAVVYDPLREELFTASRGSGAFLDNRRIRVSHQPGLEGALLATGFPYRHDEQLKVDLAMLERLVPQVAGIRRAGSAALDLAWTAAGRVDGFWELNLNAWDLAAGALLVEEAGGMVTDAQGEDRYLESGNIVAGGLDLQPHLQRLLKARLQTQS